MFVGVIVFHTPFFSASPNLCFMYYYLCIYLSTVTACCYCVMHVDCWLSGLL